MAEKGKGRSSRALVDAALGRQPEPGEPPAQDDPAAEVTRNLAGAEARRAASALAEAAASRPPAPESPAATGPAPRAESPAQSAADAEALELIEVYFAVEEPAERDAAFDRLVALPSAVVTDFLRVMLHEDEDEYLRAAAAAELARRGDAEGIAALTAELDQGDDPELFAMAAQVLGEVLGKSFYDTLATLWRDPNRDDEQRREAMLGMESVDPERALGDFVAFVEAQTDPASLPDDQLEVSMLAFVRHGHRPAEPALVALRERILAAPLEPEERTELAGLIDEGLALLADRHG